MSYIYMYQYKNDENTGAPLIDNAWLSVPRNTKLLSPCLQLLQSYVTNIKIQSLKQINTITNLPT